ncbi:MAG: phytanoyl-CoA dioxygenase family protein [Pseudomonadales bacterium]|nr:phytanoyl-CoA dioxygenase family protein [Pseudomonadales bacterium]MCP5345333.1 phytanoyl-CoA dioxygenase family protein [Pseudomonadales bacterium]
MEHSESINTRFVSTSDISEAQRDQLRQQGWVLISSALTPAQLSQMHSTWDQHSSEDNQNRELAQLSAFKPCQESLLAESAVSVLLGERFRLLSLRGRSRKPGLGQQGLHVDTVGPVDPNRQQLANAFWLLDDMSADNGATRLVPGTHRS